MPKPGTQELGLDPLSPQVSKGFRVAASEFFQPFLPFLPPKVRLDIPSARNWSIFSFFFFFFLATLCGISVSDLGLNLGHESESLES